MGKQRWSPPSSDKPVESSSWAPPSTDVLDQEPAVEKKSPNQNGFSQDGLGNFITPHPSSDSVNGSSLLEQGAATLNSVSKGQAPIQTDAPVAQQAEEEQSAVDHPIGHQDYEAQAAKDKADDLKAGGQYTPTSLAGQFNTGLASITDLGSLISKPFNQLFDQITPGNVNVYHANDLFDWASNWLRKSGSDNPLPNTFGGKVVGGVVQTVPAVLGAAASGGATTEEQLAQQVGSGVDNYLTRSDIVQNALTKAAGPLTKYLTVTKGAEEGQKAYQENGGKIIPTLVGTLQGAQSGLESGIGLEGQMAAGEKIGGDLFKLAVKTGVTNENGIITEQALKSLVGSPFAFAASSVADDVANGRPVDWQNAGVSAATALPFEAQHLLGAVDKAKAIEEQKQQLQAHVDNAVQSADSNSIVNFGTADPQDIQTAMARPESAQELQILALGKGVEAQKAQTEQEKNVLHLAQLELQKQADIKSVSNTILDKGVQGFNESVDQTELPDPLKQTLQTNANLVNTNFNPEEVIKQKQNENLKEGIDQTQAHIDQLNETNPAPVIAENPEAINSLIDMVEHRTDLQDKLLDNTENENKPPEARIDPYEQELEKLGYDKKEIDELTNEQKLHIIEHNVTSERQQGIIPETNEVSISGAANAAVSGAENVTGENAGVPQAVTSTTDAAYANGDADNAASASEKSIPVGNPFAVRSKDHGLIDLQPYEDGTYMAKFDDGSSDKFSHQELKDFFGVDANRFQQDKKDLSLHATDHPEHVAQMYLDKLHELNDTGNPESAIAQYGPRVIAKQFSDVNDKNNITPIMRMNYFQGGEGKNHDLHDQAEEINGMFFGGNPIVHAEDIANFMIKHPAGERTFFTASGNEDLKEIGDRYTELTGKKLTKASAEKVLADFENADKTLNEQFHAPANVSMINEILTDTFSFEEGKGISPEEWASKMNSQFDEYVKDPSESFNIFYPAFDGAELSEDQINRVHEFITEQQNGLTPGGRSDDQSAKQSESSGMGAENAATPAENTNDTQTARGTESAKAAEGNQHIGEQAVEDDLPFQKSEGEQLPQAKVDLAKGLLQKIFPGVETNFHEDTDSFKRALEKNDIHVNSDNLPNAFVGKDGIIHFNPEKINGDTQLHEYGHILTSWAEKFAPRLYERMQRLGSEAKGIHNELRENGYNLSGKRMNDEAFVTMLGREGAGSLDDAIKNSGTRGVVKSFINDVWNKFQRFILEKTGYDISKFKNIKNMDIGDFMNMLNSKYLLSGTEVSKVKGEDLANENSLQIKKPERSPGEMMAEYARRLGEWKRDFYNNPAGRTRSELNRLLAPVRKELAQLNRAFQEGVKKAKADTVTAFKEYTDFRKTVEQKKLSDLKDRWKKALAEEKNASGERLQKLKDETATRFKEYDDFNKGKHKDQLQNLKAKYEKALADEKRVRQEQSQKLQDGFKNIRSTVSGTLESLRKSGLLGGVKFSDKDVLAFANQVNKITTEKGLDRFKDFISRATQNVDYLRDVADNKKLISEAKQLLKKDYVPANIKSLIKEITSLNPNRVENPKELKTILRDINDSQRAKQIPQASETEINDYINKEHDYDIRTRAGDVLANRNAIENGPEHTAVAEQKGSTLPESYDLHKTIEKIVRNPELTHNEKVKKINEVNDALDEYQESLKKSIDPITNEVTGEPEDFDKILEDIQTGSSSANGETLRDNLEDITKAKQDNIDTSDPDLSPEQKESLEILKNVPLDGEDANTLRLYNNVLENVMLNDNHNGIGVFEAKAIGNSDEGALKLVNYLDEKGRGAKDASFKTGLGKLRSRGASLSVIMSRIANNDYTFVGKLNTGTHFDEIRSGESKAKQEYNNLIGKKIHAIFKEHPEIHSSPESIQKLSLFSYINQNREFSSPDQKNKELIKRITTVNKDIALKSEEGLKKDNGEAGIEKVVWDEFAQKIKEATGLDIYNKQELSGLKYADVKDLPFLNEGEKKVYDTYRDADEQLRGKHKDVVERQLNQQYEGWNNHMRDGYRFLDSGLVDVVSPGELGFTAVDQNTTDGSTSTLQRVKGDPLAAKSGEKQKVLNLNFFDVQNQNINNQLQDIYTLKARQIFDAALKNRELRDVLGNENHTLYKNTVRDYVLNSMGLNNSMGEKELKLVKQGLNFITKVGTFKQLLSLSALAKQAGATIFNTLATTGFDAPLMYKSIQKMGDEDAQKLIRDHPIGQRSENLAQLNTLNLEGVSDQNNIVDAHVKAATNFVNRYFKHLEENGAHEDKFFTKPIKWGDVKSGEWAWLTYYAKHIIETEGKSFEDIDWSKEAEKPNREAAEYAENLTAKQLNENTKAARSKFLNSGALGDRLIKSFVLEFGSFNLHKLQTMVENFRTLASKDTFVDADYRKNEAKNAGMSLTGALTEEAMFQGLKLLIGYNVAALATRGITYALSSIFGTDQEKKDALAKVDQKLVNMKDAAFQKWYTNTLGNYFFGGLGNGPQDILQRGVNDLTNSNFFYEPNISTTQKVQDANNYGMMGAAWNGNADIMKDIYRGFINNKDKYGVPVNVTPYQKSVMATSFLSNMLAMSGMNDADLNRSIESIRKQVEFSLASKFHDPNYEDISQPSPLKIGSKVVTLSQDHQAYYEQMKEERQNTLIAKGVDKKAASSAASKYAKGMLFEKYGYKAVIDAGKVKK